MQNYKFTLKQLVSLNVHLGSSSNSVHHNAGQYLVGRYSGVVLLNLNMSLLYLRRAINLIDQIVMSEGKFLLVSSDLGFQDLLKSRMRTVKNYSYSVGWLGGLLTNFKEIRYYLLRRKKYNLESSAVSISSKFSNVYSLSRVPTAVFSMGIKYTPWVQQECKRLNIPFISLVDSDVNPVGLTYSIPANDESNGFIYFLILALSSTALLSHCSKSMRFRLKVLLKANNLKNCL